MRNRLLQDGRPKDWWWMENRSVDDLWIVRLGVFAWAVYCVLVRLADATGRTMPSVGDIEKLTGVSRSEVKRSFKLLRGHNLIQKTRSGGPRAGATVYRVLPFPESPSPAAPTPPPPPPPAATGKAPAQPKHRRSGLPAGWQPNDTHRRIASEEKVDIDREAGLFRDHAAATGRTMLDWDAAFRTWLRNASNFSRGYYSKRPAGDARSVAIEEVAKLYETEEVV